MTTDSTPEFSKEGFVDMMKYFALRFAQGWTDDQVVSEVVEKGLMPLENAQTIVPIARKMWAPYQSPEDVATVKTNEQIINGLINNGIKQEAAQELVETAINIDATQPNITDMARRSIIAQRGWKRMWIGFLLLVLGGCITAVTYSSAASSPLGGSYTLCYGAIIFGAIYFLWGLVEWSSSRIQTHSPETPADIAKNQFNLPELGKADSITFTAADTSMSTRRQTSALVTPQPSKTDSNYVVCPNCGFEQWAGYGSCQKCNSPFKQLNV